ncbi:MAG: hypothetical protein MJ154_03250 [Candidatus Saccharibacteria bacterium]|nr:hypothetical protein [Candidatus Saccharibacteria bacterium]
MNVGKRKPYAILVFGAPMSGKTTFANRFSKSINAPYLNLSQLVKDYQITRPLGIEIIKQVAKSHNTLIIEGMINTEADRDEIRTLLTKAGYMPIIIWVQTDMNAIKQRMRQAYKTLAEAKVALADSYKGIEAPSDKEKTIVISGKHTYPTQCRNVINRLADLH